MKKYLTLLLLSVFINLNAQIKIFNGGLHSYGTLSAPTGNTKHLIVGNIKFGGWTSVFLDWNNGYCCGTPVIFPENDWYLQLGTPTKYLGDAYINHIMTRTGITFTSDQSVKQNINYSLNTLSKLKQLKPASYNFKNNLSSGAPNHVKNKISSVKEYGLIAQDVNQIFPELVEKDSITGLYGVKYIEFIPILIDAIQQQENKIDSLQSQLDKCCQKNNSGIKNGNRMGISNDDNINQNVASENYLLQNNPNPFNKETVIDYNIIDTGSAEILIFDMNGKLLKTIFIKIPGKGSVLINANDFSAGMYYYSLVVNDKEIDTKRMILTDK